MIERRLLRQLEKAAGRFRHLRVVLGWTVVLLLGAAAAGGLLLLNRATGWYWPAAATVLAVATGVAAALATWFAGRSARNAQWLARRVESTYPELESCLLAAVDQRPQFPEGRFSYLQLNVIQEALHHAYVNSWQRVVPRSRLFCAYLANGLAIGLFLFALMGLHRYAHPRPAAAKDESASRLVAAGQDFEIMVEPGDTEVERGTSLLVLARFGQAVPLETALVVRSEDERSSLPMNKSLDDPVFGGRIFEVTAPLSYRVEYAGHATEDYQVTVFEYPKLDRADARLTFPDYTSLEERLVQDVLRVSAVEGTRMELLCYLNKPVAHARLVSKDGEPIELRLKDEAESLYVAEMVLTESRRYELHLVDLQDRKNKQPPKFVITVLPNKPPDLKLVQPVRDMQVSPIEELDLKANVWDDFGVTRYGVAYALGAEIPEEIVLGEAAPAKERSPVEHLVAFEALGAEPDQLLSYHFWAEDTGPDGQARRVSSDMFFAEVRHFEEIFRQGQQPPGGEQQQQQQQQQGGNMQAAEQLAELQKQIISGTWKVIRRESSQPSPEFEPDTALLAQSQAEAITQAEALAEELQDARSRAFVQDVLQHMTSAFKQLSTAQDAGDPNELRSALPLEQAAYQALLKLRAREHEVIRSQQQSRSQSQSSGGASSRSQQQLQQLELDNERNRYETEQQARSQQEQQDQENRQVLNRLKELARRQGDLNERLKELQSALEEAQTEEEREEIRRQLKRLQEEQEQVLRDTEELQQQMEQSPNQEQMADPREQLQETRENVRQASEALQEGRVSRALASGARAQSELEELREEFRRQTSGRFDEEMREMRQAARELDDREQQIAERLNQLNDPEQRPASLRETGDREEIVQDMEQQSQQLQQLMDHMKQTIFESEETEPLLADQLYDTIREAQQQELDRALSTARRMLEYGFVQDAQRQEQQVRSGVSQLREGIEEAAESVLGDETEALRRAHEELQDLRQQLDDELAQANPNRQQAATPSENRPGQEGEPGQQGEPSQQADDNQQSQSAAGQRSSEDQPRSQDNNSENQSPQGGQRGEQPSEQNQQQPGGNPQQSENQSQQESNESQSSRGGGSPRGGRPQQSSGEPSEQDADRSANQSSEAQQEQQRQGGRNNSRDGFERLFQPGGPGGGGEPAAPITGDDYRQWSDRMRDVEEMIEDPELRAEAARIRDRVRGFRQEHTRHSKEPQWDLVELQVVKPLAELTDRIAEEILRRTSEDAVVPLDRDPVPARFSEQVRRYYEQLGSGN